MSWSLSLVGKPAAMIEELENRSQKFKDHSKVEYDTVKEHLKALVGQLKQCPEEVDSPKHLFELNASGSGSFSINGEMTSHVFSVHLSGKYIDLCI